MYGCFCGKLAPVGAAADLIWFTHCYSYVLNTNSASFCFVSKPGVGPRVFMLYSQTQFLSSRLLVKHWTIYLVNPPSFPSVTTPQPPKNKSVPLTFTLEDVYSLIYIRKPQGKLVRDAA